MGFRQVFSQPERRCLGKQKWLKEKNIKLAAKPLGRPSAKAVEPRKSRGKEPDRGQVWSGKKRIRNEPYQGKAQKYQSIVDSLHHPSAEPGQTGRDGTAMAEFFSMGEAGKTVNG